MLVAKKKNRVLLRRSSVSHLLSRGGMVSVRTLVGPEDERARSLAELKDVRRGLYAGVPAPASWPTDLSVYVDG